MAKRCVHEEAVFHFANLRVSQKRGRRKLTEWTVDRDNDSEIDDDFGHLDDDQAIRAMLRTK